MRPFRPDWIRYWGDDDTTEPDLRRPELDELRIDAAFDPAISQKDTAARSALVVGGHPDCVERPGQSVGTPRSR